ncbi:MAG: NADH:flavin oxidoreductase [Acidobacteria bacterium]|nr:NADH:flavin oxidoreductase [Acidobacteriota bacterium]
MKHFHYKSLDQLQQDADRLTEFVRFESDTEKIKQLLGRKVPIGNFVTLGNSMAVHPMEGCDADLDGNPDELTIRRYHRFAAGGSKLIWFEATAVRKDGRANSRQLWIHNGNVAAYDKLREEIEQIHRDRFGTIDDLLIPVQLTHSGRYSYPERIIAYHNPLIDAKTATRADQPVIGDDELERLEDQFVDAAKLVWQAGFRAIDLKVTHGYLLAELMGAKLREGRYGGSLENRTRLIRNVIGKIKNEFGSKMLIAMRLGCFDSVPYKKSDTSSNGEPLPYTTPYPHGWGVDPNDPLREELSEVKQAIGWFKDWGVQLLNVSIGCPYYNPHIGRPFEKPDEGNYEMPEHPLTGVDRHFRISGELQQAFPDLPMVGTGYSWLQIYALNAAARNIETGRIRIFGLGRGTLSYPDFAVDALEKGSLDEIRVCKTLTYCTFLMRQKNHPLGQFPAGCPPFDKLVYGPIMKQAREAFRSQQK